MVPDHCWQALVDDISREDILKLLKIICLLFWNIPTLSNLHVSRTEMKCGAVLAGLCDIVHQGPR